MLLKMLRKDFHRKKSITITLFIFVMLSAFLVSSGSIMFIKLFDSIDNLFTTSNTPHFVQMHAGEVDQTEIDRWTSSNSLVKDQQTVEMVGIDGANIFLGNSHEPEKNSVMDISFVKQNKSFDYLLDLENQVIQVSKGEVGVPIYYMQEENLKLGDKVRISNGSFDKEFTVAYFVQDAQMNPSVVSSKRFLVNDADFETLKNNFDEKEYLIEFLLKDLSKLSEFSQAYQSSNLPHKGPSVDYGTFKILNALTEGIVPAVILLVSILLMIIAILCLRLTILATIEEEYREIGVMKAIGIDEHYIKKIYLFKYIVLAALASIAGYLGSLFISPLFIENIMLYIGTTSDNILHQIIPFISVSIIFFIVVFFCRLTLRRFNKITTVEALRAGSIGETKISKGFLPMHKSKYLDVNIFLGLKDILGRLKMFGLLFFVFIVCSIIIIVPVNFLNTIQSPSFIKYMGVGQSDIRIDLQQSDDIVQRFNDVLTYIENDKDVEKFSPMITSRFNVIDSDGVLENISIETGDFSIFPLEYLEGAAPSSGNEIVLSYLNAKEMGKSVGDTLSLIVDDNKKEMVVSGIYQDITNGGRTAKALLPVVNNKTVLWYVVNLDVKRHVNIGDKIHDYTEAFHSTKVTHLEGYLAQTLGGTIEQLKLMTIVAIVIAICVSILITSLFVQMLVAKDYSQIAIMKSIGFSLKDIQVQNVVKVLLVMVIGIIVGTIISNTIGQSLVNVLLSFLGASKIEFVINPVQAYVLCPLILILSVTVTTLLSTKSLKQAKLADLRVE
ncbi:ABC transporter permease [Jeotgalibacillus marinus]|uniref:FtsX-like permease family protein n=1 Tax=Jeotgalibacillus marinus TaxID=86667 RepID=A0ABV3Q647_9BACL